MLCDSIVILLAILPIFTDYSSEYPLRSSAEMVPVKVSPAPVVLATLLLLIGLNYLIYPFDEIIFMVPSPLVIMVLTPVYLLLLLALPTL